MKSVSIIFTPKNSECTDCNIKRGVKRYFDNKDKKSIQQEINYQKEIQINYYRNKKIIERKETQIEKN